MATEATHDEYRTAVEAAADGVIEAVENYDAEVADAVFEETDSTQWVIYTDKNLKVLQFSSHQPQEWKHLVANGDSWQQVVQAMAFDVFRQDVWGELDRRDFEW